MNTDHVSVEDPYDIREAVGASRLTVNMRPEHMMRDFPAFVREQASRGFASTGRLPPELFQQLADGEALSPGFVGRSLRRLAYMVVPDPMDTSPWRVPLTVRMVAS